MRSSKSLNNTPSYQSDFMEQGYVSGQRVQGRLAVSRSLGDAALKVVCLHGPMDNTVNHF